LDIGVLGYIGIVQHKEHSPEVLHIPPGTPCIHISPHHLKNENTSITTHKTQQWTRAKKEKSAWTVLNVMYKDMPKTKNQIMHHVTPE